MPISIISTISQISCHDANDGQISVEIESSSPPYSYRWSDNSQDSLIANLGPGDFNLTVSDALGCTETISFQITNPPPINSDLILLDSISCASTIPALINLEVTGGESPYLIEWEDGQVGEMINSFIPGVINYTVTDIRNCIHTGTGIVIQEEGFQIEVLGKTDLQCFSDSTAEATIQATGGIDPYFYNWENGQSESYSNMLHAGINYITITDSEGCEQIEEIRIDSPSEIIITGIDTPTSCFGGDDGRIDISISGGTVGVQNYIIEWENGSSDSFIENLEAGIYCVTITDQNNCEKQSCFEVFNAELIEVLSIEVLPLCEGDFSGSISLTSNGGTGNFAYNWSGPDNYTSVLGQIG